jgi:hypothetical protein
MDESLEGMREQARAWVARTMEAMGRGKWQSLDDYADPGRTVPHWLDSVLRQQDESAEWWAAYPVVYRLPNPDGRVVCWACFYDYYARNEDLEYPPPVASQYARAEELFETHCLVLGSIAFRVIFGKSLICNHCERVVTEKDVHVCVPEGSFIAHVRGVLRDPSGILPAAFLEEMAEPLFDRAVYAGIFRACRWHQGNYTIPEPLGRR